MARYDYGEVSGQLDDVIAKMNAGGRAQDELNAKVKQYEDTLEGEQATERVNIELRTTMADATERLAASLREGTSLIAADTAEWRGNNTVLQENLRLRRELSQYGAVAAPVSAPATVIPERVGPGGGGGGGGGPPRPPAPPGGGGGGPNDPEDYNRKLAAQRAILEEATASQGAYNMAEQEAAARYAASSNALSRHGALTTEFIQALARGDVTLQEFGSQMVSTIGKFGGWIVAGAAVFGVIKLFEDLKNGAVETQNAIETLGRFLPGLGGPAGGGTGQIQPAEQLLRSISQQFNVPISEVGDTMQITARVFKDLGGAGEATRAALAASRLDQIPVEMSTQYLLGIAQSLGMPTQGPGAGEGLVGVVNSLNALQSGIGARVSQTLPAVARAAPAAAAAGMPLTELEAITGVAVRAGIPGGQVGTALARSLANFVFRPAAQEVFAHLGISQPTLTDAGSIYSGVFSFIDREARAGRPVSQVTLRSLAGALASPQIGARSILPLLEAEQLRPGTYAAALQQAQSPRPYQEDLNQQLQRITEQFKSIGIALQNFGSQLASIGALTPVTDLFDVLRFLGHTFQAMASPIEQVLGLFNRLPTPVEDVLAAFLAIAASRALLQRTFVGTTAQQFAGRLTGVEELQSSAAQRDFLRQRRADIRNVLMPEAERELMTSGRARYLAAGELRQAPGIAAGMSTEEGAAYMQAAQRKATAATERESIAAERVAGLQEALAIILDRRLTIEERIAALESRGYVGGGPPPIAGGAPAAGGVAEGVAGAAGIAAVVGAAADTLADPALMSRITSNVQQGLGPTPVVPAEGVAPPETVPLSQRPRIFIAPEEGPATLTLTGQRRFLGTGYAPPRVEEPVPGPAPVAAEQLTMDAMMTGMVGAQQRALSISGLMAGARQNPVIGGIASGLDTVTNKLSTFGNVAKQVATGPMGPFAGLLATQLAASAIPGQTGQDISRIAGGVFTGAIVGQMVRPGSLTAMGIGATAGNIAAGFQGGTTSGLFTAGGAAIGTAAGAVLGSILPGPGTAAGAVIGSIVGSTAGQIAGTLFGGQQDPNKKAQEQLSAAQKQAQTMITQSVGTQSALNQWGNDFSDALTQSLTGTSSSAQAAQAKVQTIMEGLTAKMQLFGAQSQQGKDAANELGQVVSSATDIIDINPQEAQNLIQGVQSTFQNTVTRTTELMKYAAPSAIPGLLSQAQAQITPSVQAANQQLADAQARQQQLDAAIARRQTEQQRAPGRGPFASPFAGGGYSDIISQMEGQNVPYAGYSTAQLQRMAAANRQHIQEYKAVDDYVKALARDALDQLASAAVAMQEQVPAAQAQAAAARTTDPSKQATIALNETNAHIKRIQDSSESQRQKTIDLGPLLQQRQQQMEAYGQSEVALRQATDQAAAAAIPSVDPVRRAAAAVKDTTDIYNYIKGHMNQFTPEQLQQALGAMNAAAQSMADAQYSYNSELFSAEEQLAEAQAKGDPFKIAAAQGAAGQKMLGIARSQPQRDAANAQILGAATASAEAARSLIQIQGQTAETLATGNPVEQAQLAIGVANKLKQTALNSTEAAQADQLLAAGQVQLRQALEQQDIALGALAASQTADPVKQITDQIGGVVKALARAPAGSQEAIGLQTQLNQLKLQKASTLESTRAATIQFEFDMMQISSGSAIKQLQDLLKIKNLAPQTYQQIREQIRRFQLGLETPIGGGTMDIAPGNIRLPTFYDVSHAMRQGRLSGAGRPMSNIDASSSNTINVYVHRNADVGQVADVIDRTTGSHLRQRLRAAGVR